MRPGRPGLRSRGRSKGYTRYEREDRDKFLARRRKTIAVTGVVGTVENLYDRVDAILKRRNWNWATLGERCRYSRQHLVKMTEADQISEDFLRLLCNALEVPMGSLLRRVEIDETEDQPQ
jgi:DNA-binding Xre family transcriptional regulator